jgi:hypothetical protein
MYSPASAATHAEGVLYGMELGSVTLKRIGFFCFPIKHSTHTLLAHAGGVLYGMELGSVTLKINTQHTHSADSTSGPSRCPRNRETHTSQFQVPAGPRRPPRPGLRLPPSLPIQHTLSIRKKKKSRNFHTLEMGNLQKLVFLHTQKVLFHTLKNDFIL